MRTFRRLALSSRRLGSVWRAMGRNVKTWSHLQNRKYITFWWREWFECFLMRMCMAAIKKTDARGWSWYIRELAENERAWSTNSGVSVTAYNCKTRPTFTMSYISWLTPPFTLQTFSINTDHRVVYARHSIHTSALRAPSSPLRSCSRARRFS